MHARFSIAIDPSRDLVTIVMNGLFLPGDVADFSAARRKAIALLHCAPGQQITLADLRALRILPRETVDAFAAMLTDTRSRSRRLAFIVAPSLVRNQLIRALAGINARCFIDPAEAKTWLLEKNEAAREPVSRHRSAPEKASKRHDVLTNPRNMPDGFDQVANVTEMEQ